MGKSEPDAVRDYLDAVRREWGVEPYIYVPDLEAFSERYLVALVQESGDE